MQKTIIKSLLLIIAFTFALSANYIFAVWTGPTQAPPGGNTPTPIHVGAVDQTKDAGLALNSLAVFGNGFFDGNVGIKTSNISTGGEQDLSLDVEGAIGAKFYCDENGNNCASAPLGGGCYVSYSGTCLSGFTNKGSAGAWGVCKLDSGYIHSTYLSPPGGGCSVAYSREKIGEAYVCCW